MNKKEEPERVGTLGWQSFLNSKHEMLYQYRLAQKYSKSHTVQTFHGNVAEAVFRKWLAKFLPKRYAVTSGYVISQRAKDLEKMPHFDVIVYDQIESPILWHEESPDSSKAGVSRAIPAEHVVAVFEVKSSFEVQTSKKAVQKLLELEEMLKGEDLPEERFKEFLPANFCTGIIFFELRSKNKNQKESLRNLLDAKNLRGYMGALVLEGEDVPNDKSARIYILPRASCLITTTIAEDKEDLFGSPLYGDPEQQTDGSYSGASLMWGETNFANFMFDMIAIWSNTYKPGFVSSMHGMSHLNPKRGKN